MVRDQMVRQFVKIGDFLDRVVMDNIDGQGWDVSIYKIRYFGENI